MFNRCAATVIALSLAACATQSVPPSQRGVMQNGFSPSHLVKTEIDRVVETHQREVFASLRVLTEKLYRRNPREWRKSGQPSLEAAVARLFDTQHDWRFAELDNRRGVDVLHMAFRDDFQGDRVFALMAGLGGMIQTAFNDKSE